MQSHLLPLPKRVAPIRRSEPTASGQSGAGGARQLCRSEPQASGPSGVEDAHQLCRSEPQASGQVHKARGRSIERRPGGFTLIEIMAVVVIIGLLTGIVGTAIIGRLNQANATTAKTQIKQIEAALDFYRMDNGRYPTSEQGLDALVNPSSVEPAPRNFRPEGYLQGGKVPADPWGSPYEYESPGTHNPYGVDIWSFGADGQPGGSGADADVGNWSEESG